MADLYRLGRFTAAQDQDGTYPRVLAELRAGRKRTHWIWFIFPQIEGLGRSAMAREYALSSLAEARAYLDHPVLGPRLVECALLLVAAGSGGGAGDSAGADDGSGAGYGGGSAAGGATAVRILGDIDAVKVRSSMTLFAAAAPEQAAFRAVLDRFYGGAADPATLARL